jgi:hypothetical protein
MSSELGTLYFFSGLALNIRFSRFHRLFHCTCISYPALDAEYTRRKEARFCFVPWARGVPSLWSCPYFTCLLGQCCSRPNLMGMYVKWSESELCKHFSSHRRLIISIVRYSSRLSFRRSHYSLTAASTVDHHRLSLPPCLPHSSLVAGHTPPR